MFGDDAVRDGKAEAGAGAFRCEEGVEDVRDVFAFDAGAGVADGDAEPGLGRE